MQANRLSNTDQLATATPLHVRPGAQRQRDDAQFISACVGAAAVARRMPDNPIAAAFAEVMSADALARELGTL